MPKLSNIVIKDEKDSEIIHQINQLIAQYNQTSAQAINTAILERIISICESYITSVPREERSNFLDENDTGYLQLLTKLPHINEIVQLEKSILQLLELSKYGQNMPKAQWKLLSKFFLSGEDNPTNTPVKTLGSEYYNEFKYAGNLAKSKWINHLEPIYNNAVLSLQEILTNKKDEIIYLDNIAPYQLQIKHGLVYDKDEQPFSTKKSFGMNIKDGYCIFVLSANLQLYASDPKTVLNKNFHHSSFFQGRPVACAGAIKVNNGKIIEINLLSGHYKPNRKHLLTFLNLLEAQGLDISTIKVKDHPNGSLQNAKEYLARKGYLAGEVSYRAANEAKIPFPLEYKHNLEHAIKIGHVQAKYDKARALIYGSQAYPKDISQGIFLLLSLKDHKDFASKVKKALDEISPAILSIYNIYKDVASDTEKENKIGHLLLKVEETNALLFLADFSRQVGDDKLLANVQKHILSLVKDKIDKSSTISLSDNANILKILQGSRNLTYDYGQFKEQNAALFEQEQAEPPRVSSSRLQPRKRIIL
ncbi:hypothetical protein ACNVED_01035 [Legionella sp. D16C41]|uniref:hypothetical protein n=1 Tax=Legionella sp. D16C41 TaxID=3402688 RepID=UPI003AF428B0